MNSRRKRLTISWLVLKFIYSRYPQKKKTTNNNVIAFRTLRLVKYHRTPILNANYKAERLINCNKHAKYYRWQTIINFPSQSPYHQIKFFSILAAHKSWQDLLQLLCGPEMGTNDAAILTSEFQHIGETQIQTGQAELKYISSLA